MKNFTIKAKYIVTNFVDGPNYYLLKFSVTSLGVHGLKLLATKIYCLNCYFHKRLGTKSIFKNLKYVEVFQNTTALLCVLKKLRKKFLVLREYYTPSIYPLRIISIHYYHVVLHVSLIISQF